MTREIGAFVAQEKENCSGCRACELACFAAHGQNAKTVGNITVPVVPRLFVSRDETGVALAQCHHCEDAPCLMACKQGAISRVDGQVIMDSGKCGECGDHACAEACVFGAIKLLPAAAKCDLCMEQAEGPACVRACPNQALRLVDVETERAEKNANALRFLRHMI